MTVNYLVGDSRARCAELEPGSVSLVATSPPFLALRSYLPADAPGKADEIGSESDPAAFLDVLLACTAEWGRVLAPWGSIAIELGDTYAGSGGGGGDYLPGGLREGQQQFAGSASASMRESNAAHWRQKNQKFDRRAPGGQPYADTFKGGGPGGNGWPSAKSLALIPQLYAVALAYGINPLTGAPSPAGRWLVRNVLVWHRPNPAVGALGDKYRPSTSYIVVATRSAKRWFDLTAVRQPLADSPGNRYVRKVSAGDLDGRANATNGIEATMNKITAAYDPTKSAGAPPLDAWFDHHDTWTLTTQPSSLAHYAMWPAKLAERLILSMCPLEVCSVCGEPRRRVERTLYVETPNRNLRTDDARRYGSIDGKRHNDHRATSQDTLGWSDCGHGGQWTPGRVLDPFAGTGTTLAVADLHGRDAIGVDLDARNRDLYPRRREECARALFGTQPEMPGQMGLFGETA